MRCRKSKCFSIDSGRVGSEMMAFCAAITRTNQSKYKVSSSKSPDEPEIWKEWLKTAINLIRENLKLESRVCSDTFSNESVEESFAVKREEFLSISSFEQ